MNNRFGPQEDLTEEDLIKTMTDLPRVIVAQTPVAVRTNTKIDLEKTQIIPSTPFPSAVGSRTQLKRKRRLPLVIGAVIGLLILLGAGAIGWSMLKSPGVVVYKLKSQDVVQDIGGGGIVFAKQQLDITYPVEERVVTVMVKPGDQVIPNQSLVQLDPAQLNLQITQAADDVSAAQSYLNSVSGSGNAVQTAQAQQQYNLAKNKYNALLAQASSPLLRNGILISPMSGVVTSVDVNAGSVFAANTPLLTIMDESTLIVHTKVALSNLGKLHLGQPATVKPTALPDTTLQGTVTAIIPQADPQTDTFEVWVSINNSDKSVLPGMTAFVHIQTGSKALVVPRLAVLDADSQAAVFVVGADQRVHLQRVQVSGRSEHTIYISQGLSAGDRVVLVGLDTLQDGQSVHISSTEANMTAS